jgi:uncharacterized protein with PQ loop repeat
LNKNHLPMYYAPKAKWLIYGILMNNPQISNHNQSNLTILRAL